MSGQRRSPRPARRLRARERRVSVADVVKTIAHALAVESPRRLRGRLEEALGRCVGARGVRIQVGRMLPTGTVPVVQDGGGVDIPIPASGAVLHASISPLRPLDDWDVQVLQGGAHVAALVLEIERSALAQTRPGQARPHPAGLVGSSALMQTLRERIERVARTDFAVLIEGESGVGKELVARQVHLLSRRARGPFVAVNCAAIVETLVEAELFGIEDHAATGVKGRRGKFELAAGGTLFLDEISDLSPTAQAKLLRALQDLSIDRVGAQAVQHVDIRVIAATNRSLDTLVAEGRFRLDLFHRLNCVDVRVPPLRARREDLEELSQAFLVRHRELRVMRISDEAMEALGQYDWPGNVRELERVLERAVALADTETIQISDLPPAITGRYREIFAPSLASGDSLRTMAGRYARLVLRRCRNNKREACRVLDISYHTLQAYLRQGTVPMADDAGVGQPELPDETAPGAVADAAPAPFDNTDADSAEGEP